MDSYTNWEEVNSATRAMPLPHENFDQYFAEYDEIDNLFNETLTGLQDLDVPSGFASQLQDKLETPSHQKHARKTSGTAIFGFVDHTRELSITGLANDLYKPIKQSLDLGKSISPGELLKSLNASQSQQFDFEVDPIVQKPILLLEEDELNEQQKASKDIIPASLPQSSPMRLQPKQEEYIVTNESPKSYKFPPSPSPSPSRERIPANGNARFQTVNNYSVKYLQELNNQGANLQQNYVDDIEPLIDGTGSEQKSNFNVNNNQIKYIPIPIQQPVVYKKENESPSVQQFQQAQFQQQAQQQVQQHSNTYLPPPSPPSLSNASPELSSSPDPLSPSPNRSVISGYESQKFSSPLHPQLRNANVNFYSPQFFSESDNGSFYRNNDGSNISQQQQMNSSPGYSNSSLSSSPVKYYTSPIRVPGALEEVEDANATITQLTPLRNQFPSTPARNQVTLEWSPVISPSAKASKDVKKHIQQSTPRRRVKKTSLLPPGELDQYWEGPDEDKIYTCTYKNCGKKFTRRYNVRSHIQTHLSDRPFACAYCPKRFVRQHDLNRHVKGHLEARHCRCPCGKEFVRLDALKKHRERNICVGGIASSTNHCITKPQPKKKDSVYSELMISKVKENQDKLL
ncbi:Metallothionein expression activator, partial [Scheffersomyces stipitis CBS 6054]